MDPREPGPLADALPLRCRCGHVRGVVGGVSPSSGFRFVCYCTDCQTFARFLGRPNVLDAAGGTDIFQLPPRRVTLTTGMDALKAIQLSKKVIRWYASCCRTPIGNTAAGPEFPMVALIHAFMDHEADGRSRDVVLGPPRCRIYERSALGPLPSPGPPAPSFGVFARRASKLLGWWVRGLGRPTPFFDPKTGAPRAEPEISSPEELNALRSPK